MHPVLKRILISGGLTAGILGLVGLLFAELASVWTAGNTGKPGSADLNPTLPPDLKYRVPLTMAGGGFLFVAVCELLGFWFRKPKPASTPAKPGAPDDAEKLLNELLAQAEAKMAAEAQTPAPAGDGRPNEPKGEDKPA